MKKFFALALCALMMVSLSVAAFAAEENAFEYNFEDDGEGEFIAIDNSIKFYPKQQGKITIAKFDGTMAAKFEQVGFTQIEGQMDCYADFVAGGVSTYGVGTKYILEYDVYFEKIGMSNLWQIFCSRETPPAGTQFQQVGHFEGTEDGKVGLRITRALEEGETNDFVATFETGKWLTVSACMDKDNHCFSVYVDGVCYAKDMDYTISDPSAPESERARCAWTNAVALADGTFSDGIAYIDNIKLYNGTEPRNVTVATPATTTAAPVTEAPVATDAATEAAPAPTAPATQTADVAVILAAVAAVAASGVVVLKKKH